MPSPRAFAIVDHDWTAEERKAIRRQRRQAKQRDPNQPARNGVRTTTVLINDPLNPDRLASQPNGVWLRLTARLFASRLDRQLAAGLPPESNGLLAARAQALVSALMRTDLAVSWEAVLARINRPPAMRDPRMPLCRDRVAAAEDDVRAMLTALVAPLPVSARGVAMASQLLCDGRGPLFNRRSSADLGAAVRGVVAQLDPAMSLTSSG